MPSLLRVKNRGGVHRGSMNATILIMLVAIAITTNRYCELIAHLATERTGLHKTQMMRIGRTPTTNQAGLFDDMPDMVAVANASRCEFGGERLAATTHILCWSCGMYFSAAVSSENDQGSMNLASNTAPVASTRPSSVAAIQRSTGCRIRLCTSVRT